MKNHNLVRFAITGVLASSFIAFTKVLTIFDVSPIGPKGSKVGFASINKWVADIVGVNMTLYNITDWLGVVAILVAFGFAVLGLIQLTQRKSLKRVDIDILLLGAFYILVIGAYAFFEIFAVNFRPVLIEGILEASYPSSTTMLVLCVMSTAVMQFRVHIANTRVKYLVSSAAIIFTIFVVIGRLLSGVHWLTDILGGLLLSSTMVMLYYSSWKYYESTK